MKCDDMDISESEDEEDDDEADFEQLLSSLTGMEKCLLPAKLESKKVAVTPEKKAENNDVSQENRAKSLPKTTISTSHEIVESNKINLRNHSVEAVSPTNSNASTLSRESTPKRQLSHCPKDTLLDKSSDSDVIIDHINEFRKILEVEIDSDNSDIACIGTKNDVIGLGTKLLSGSALSPNPDLDEKSNDSVVLKDTATNSSKNNPLEVMPLTVISIESKRTDMNSLEDIDSDSDCLIVEHIAASDHRQNGLIDLTKPTSDEDASLPLQERTEESLLKEISKIRKALTEHTKKKHKKKKKKHKSSKKNKNSKLICGSKSPSLEKNSESENDNPADEARTIMMSESGHLCVNITNNSSKTDSDDSSGANKSNSTLSAVTTEKSPPKDSSNEQNSVVTKDNETESNNLPVTAGKRKGNKHRKIPFDKTNKFNRYLSNSDDSDSNLSKSQRVPSTDAFNKLVSDSDSDKSLNSTASKKSRKNIDSDEDKIHTLLMKSPDYGFAKNSFNWKRSKEIHRKRSRSRSYFNSFTSSPSRYRLNTSSSFRNSSGFYRSPSHSRRSKSRNKTPARNRDYEYRRSISKSISPDYRVLESKSSWSRRSRSHWDRSPSRSCRSKSRTYRSPSRSRRSKSRKCRSPSRSRRSKSRRYRSPSRSRRSKSRRCRSPSRLRRSKSRTRKSPSRSGRSKSRTHRSPSRSHRSKSRRRSSRRRSEDRSPSEIRAARKCSPLEDMRQQLRKTNEAAVQQAMGSLEKREKNAAARIIVDLTKSPSPENSTMFNRNTPRASATTQAVVPQQERPLHPYNAAKLHENCFMFPHSPARLRQIHPLPNFMSMPVPMTQNPGMINHLSIFQISQVYSQAAGSSESYVPMYPHPNPPYM